jgi:pSer/pThr/pTyr-binding forkhead associated (FHA) protein
MYCLVFQNCVAPKEPLVVDLPSLVIGRHADCHVQVAEPGVSDRHATIERHADGYYVRRLDGSVDLWVNGDPVTQRRLASGDELEIGPARIRFEIVHGAGVRRQRRPIDLLQLLATAIVLAVIVGEIALLGSMFSENRPKKVKLNVASATPAEQADTGPGGLSAAATTASSRSRPQPGTAAAAQPPAEPTVLNRMVRIMRVDRTESGGVVSVTIQTKAQVGERELDPSAVAICVQFAALDGVDWRKPVWLQIPPWENFTTKAFTVRFPGTSHELVGFVVRTYYHQQMQDVAAAPLSLRPLAPNPLVGGAS